MPLKKIETDGQYLLSATNCRLALLPVIDFKILIGLLARQNQIYRHRCLDPAIEATDVVQSVYRELLEFPGDLRLQQYTIEATARQKARRTVTRMTLRGGITGIPADGKIRIEELTQIKPAGLAQPADVLVELPGTDILKDHYRMALLLRAFKNGYKKSWDMIINQYWKQSFCNIFPNLKYQVREEYRLLLDRFSPNFENPHNCFDSFKKQSKRSRAALLADWADKGRKKVVEWRKRQDGL